MHELSIASTILTTVLREMERRQISAISAIGIRIGALSGIEPEALQFSFDAIKIDTPVQGAELKIEQVLLQGQCQVCDQVFGVESYVFACPHCQSNRIKVIRGEELDIAYLEIPGEPRPNA